jgi:hypothetical protein
VLERLEAFLIVISTHPVSADRPLRRLDIAKPDPVSRRALWKQALGPAADAHGEDKIDAIAEHFDFSSVDILRSARRGILSLGGAGFEGALAGLAPTERLRPRRARPADRAEERLGR